MKMRISINTCRRALSIMRWSGAGGTSLTLDGEEEVITQVMVRDGHWYSGGHRLTRREQEALTRRAEAIIEEDRRRTGNGMKNVSPACLRGSRSASARRRSGLEAASG